MLPVKAYVTWCINIKSIKFPILWLLFLRNWGYTACTDLSRRSLRYIQKNLLTTISRKSYYSTEMHRTKRQKNDMFLPISVLSVSRAAGHHVENATAVASKEPRWAERRILHRTFPFTTCLISHCIVILSPADCPPAECWEDTTSVWFGLWTWWKRGQLSGLGALPRLLLSRRDRVRGPWYVPTTGCPVLWEWTGLENSGPGAGRLSRRAGSELERVQKTQLGCCSSMIEAAEVVLPALWWRFQIGTTLYTKWCKTCMILHF